MYGWNVVIAHTAIGKQNRLTDNSQNVKHGFGPLTLAWLSFYLFSLHVRSFQFKIWGFSEREIILILICLWIVWGNYRILKKSYVNMERTCKFNSGNVLVENRPITQLLYNANRTWSRMQCLCIVTVLGTALDLELHLVGSVLPRMLLTSKCQRSWFSIYTCIS